MEEEGRSEHVTSLSRFFFVPVSEPRLSEGLTSFCYSPEGNLSHLTAPPGALLTVCIPRCFLQKATRGRLPQLPPLANRLGTGKMNNSGMPAVGHCNVHGISEKGTFRTEI